jgi:hypothetical protein
MKIIYSGGYDKYSTASIADSIFYRYSTLVNKLSEEGKKVVSINFAKPDSYYDSRLEELYQEKILSIDNRNKQSIKWSEYDFIFIPGGDQNILKKQLLNTGFSFDLLKDDVIIVGDSAGAYVLAAYYPDFGEDLKSRESKDQAGKGLHPQSNLLVLAHVDNQRYIPEMTLERSRSLAQKLEVKFLPLKENEEKMLTDRGKLIDFKINSLLN